MRKKETWWKTFDYKTGRIECFRTKFPNTTHYYVGKEVEVERID